MHPYKRKNFSIYKIENKINNRCYIGFASDFDRRIKQHITNAKTKSSLLYDDINKYGIDNFDICCLYESWDIHFTLNHVESEMIKLYKSHYLYGGYNMTQGGEGYITLRLAKKSIRKQDKMKRKALKKEKKIKKKIEKID